MCHMYIGQDQGHISRFNNFLEGWTCIWYCNSDEQTASPAIWIVDTNEGIDCYLYN